jgi:hypothetical protein
VKKLVTLFVIALMLFSMAGCKKGESKKNNTSASETMEGSYSVSWDDGFANLVFTADGNVVISSDEAGVGQQMTGLNIIGSSDTASYSLADAELTLTFNHESMGEWDQSAVINEDGTIYIEDYDVTLAKDAVAAE